MSQKFIEKRIAAAVSLALTAGVVGVAGANEFAASALTGSSSSGVNVPKAASASVAGFSANIVSTDGTLNNTLPSGSVVLTLDNGAKFASGQTLTFTFVSGVSVTAAAGAVSYPGWNGGVGAAGTNVATVTASGGLSSLTIPGVTATGSGTNFNLKVSGITLNTSGSTLDTAVNLSLDSSSTFGGTGLTTGSSVKIATVKSAGATASVTGTAPTVVANTTLSIPSFYVSENIVQSIKGLTKGAIRLTLPTGINFTTASNSTTPVYVSVADSAGSNNLFVSSSATGASNVLVLGQFDANTGAIATSGTGASKFTFGALKAFVPSGQATGDINLTVEATLDGTTDTYTSLGTLKVGTVATAATTVGALSAGSSTTQYATLYTGRSYASISGAYTTGVKLTENVPGTLASGGTVTFKVANAVASGVPGLFSTSLTPTSNGVTGTGATTAADTYVYTLTGASSGTADTVSAALQNFKVAAGASGKKVQVTVSSTTNLTGATVDVANIADATSASASGTLPTGLAGATVSLPDVVITESNYAALVASGAVTITAPFATIDSFDASAATVKAYKADGTDVTGSNVVASNTTVNTTAGASGGNLPQAYFSLSATQSTSTTGPVYVKVSGLKAKLGTAGTGDVNVTVGGQVATTGTTLAAVVDADAGSKATPVSVKVAQFVGNVISVPTATVTGAITSQTITSSVIPASGDLGKQGSVFVAASIPNVGVFLLNSSGAWSLFKDAASAPAYYTGSLASISSIPVVSNADLSGIVGTDVYVGYGTGGALSPAGTAWNNMVNNGTYSKTTTIAK